MSELLSRIIHKKWEIGRLREHMKSEAKQLYKLEQELKNYEVQYKNG